MRKLDSFNWERVTYEVKLIIEVLVNIKNKKRRQNNEKTIYGSRSSVSSSGDCW